MISKQVAMNDYIIILTKRIIAIEAFWGYHYIFLEQ